MSEIRPPKIYIECPCDYWKSIRDLENYQDDSHDTIKNLEQRLFGMVVGGINSLISKDSDNPIFDAQIAFNEFLDEYKSELINNYNIGLWLDEYQYGNGEFKKYFEDVEAERKRHDELQREKDDNFKRLNLNKWNFDSYNVYEYLERHQDLLKKYLAQENGMSPEDFKKVYELYRNEADSIFAQITGNGIKQESNEDK